MFRGAVNGGGGGDVNAFFFLVYIVRHFYRLSLVVNPLFFFSSNVHTSIGVSHLVFLVDSVPRSHKGAVLHIFFHCGYNVPCETVGWWRPVVPT